MKQSELLHFAPLYTASRYYGAGKILLDWLDEKDLVLPLTLPHGVEFPGQYREPIDVRRMEPIYWAINRDLHQAASRIKPSLLLPHPLLLSPAFAESEKTTRSGILIIGTPPGRTNDINLLRSLQTHGLKQGTILVKRRRGWECSARFWQDQGYSTKVFGDPFSITYNDMAKTFSSYEQVVSTTISTAIFLAAACGTAIKLIKDSAFQAYELLNVEKIMAPHNFATSAWLRQFVTADKAEQGKLALSMLGNDLIDKKRIRSELIKTIGDIRQPLFIDHHSNSKMFTYFQAWAAIRLRRPRLATMRLSSALKLFSKPKVGILTTKDIDFHLDGPSPTTHSLIPVPFRRGITEPGHAVDPY